MSFLLTYQFYLDKKDLVRCCLASNTGSQETWEVVTGWLHQCLRDHAKCSQTAKADWLPTRLLDVGTERQPQVRLYITDRAALTLQYTTLSHCWGNLQIKSLTKADLLSWTAGIDIIELPKTFQDAIAITRRLSVRYLWIDSLCIIQDSTEDWNNESSSMGDIYMNCFCNIAATGAFDGRTGCFVDRNPLLAQTCRISTELLPQSQLQPGLYDFIRQSLFDDGVLDAPLNCRAWVVQERVLSPRIIHFGKSQIFWECLEAVRFSLPLKEPTRFQSYCRLNVESSPV
jgi:hypothetical protein